MPLNADLHMHSAFSTDGEFTPDQLVRMAADAGLNCVALTDHNHVGGVKPAITAGRAAGVVVIPAVEIDCVLDGMHLHILGYGVDPEASDFETLWQNVRKNESAASKELLERVAKLGIAVDAGPLLREAEENGTGIVTAERIAEVALADPRNGATPLLAPFRPGGARDDNPLVNFYWDVCSPGKPAHVHVPYIDMVECVDIIDGSGGTPVLAHPGQSIRDRADRLPDIVRNGVRGIEVFCSYHSPDDARRWLDAAKDNALFVTCGSDFHGKTKPAVKLGGHGAGENVEKLLMGLFEELA